MAPSPLRWSPITGSHTVDTKFPVSANPQLSRGAPRLVWLSLTHTAKTGKVHCPGGPVVKNLPAGAGDMGSNPGPGRSHMLWGNQASAPQLQSLCSRTREPTWLSY